MRGRGSGGCGRRRWCSRTRRPGEPGGRWGEGPRAAPWGPRWRGRCERCGRCGRQSGTGPGEGADSKNCFGIRILLRCRTGRLPAPDGRVRSRRLNRPGRFGRRDRPVLPCLPLFGSTLLFRRGRQRGCGHGRRSWSRSWTRLRESEPAGSSSRKQTGTIRVAGGVNEGNPAQLVFFLLEQLSSLVPAAADLRPGNDQGHFKGQAQGVGSIQLERNAVQPDFRLVNLLVKRPAELERRSGTKRRHRNTPLIYNDINRAQIGQQSIISYFLLLNPLLSKCHPVHIIMV